MLTVWLLNLSGTESRTKVNSEKERIWAKTVQGGIASWVCGSRTPSEHRRSTFEQSTEPHKCSNRLHNERVTSKGMKQSGKIKQIDENSKKITGAWTQWRVFAEIFHLDFSSVPCHRYFISTALTFWHVKVTKAYKATFVCWLIPMIYSYCEPLWSVSLSELNRKTKIWCEGLRGRLSSSHWETELGSRR